MTNNNLFKGLRKRDTYNSLVGYLDGGQEQMRYPNRLATQLANSYQLSNIVDIEGKSWFQENKEQMRNFTEQQVQDRVLKENLEPGQTFEEEKILQRQRDEELLRQQQAKQKDWEDWQEEKRADAQEQHDIEEAKKKEDGVVELFKKEMRNKIAQEAAAYVMKKAIENLPGLIARVV
jgi:hypothetical protein